MTFTFTREEAEQVAKLLGAEEVTQEKEHWRLKLTNVEEKRIMTLEIYPETQLGKVRGALVVVYTGNSHLQLHNCTGFVLSEDLGEVTFVAESDNRLSGLVVERGASCSQYASVSRDLISSDFTQLGVEVMLSGVAMSLAEQILDGEIPQGEEDE